MSKPTEDFHLQRLALRHGEGQHILPYQLHTWGAKASSKTSFSFPAGLLLFQTSCNTSLTECEAILALFL